MSYSCIERHRDNVYLNVVFQNDPNSPNLETVAEYNITKTIALLDKPCDYYMAVIRFDVPLNGVPLLVIPIVPNQGNPNLTPMVFGINGNNTNAIYVPDNNIAVPTQNQQKQVITPYYYIFSFQNVIDSFNTALATSYVAAGSPGGAGAPFFIFNPVTQLISLVVSTAFIAAGATITLNQYAENFLEGFRYIFTGANMFQFVLENTGANGFAIPGQTIAVTTPPTFLTISQEYNCMEYWLSLRKIVLLSNTIPIYFENVPGFDPNTGAQTGISVSTPIITDFIPNISNASEARSVAIYNPLSQYRLADLLGNNPLHTVDLKIYWQDKLGNLYPLFIQVLQQASVKIGFFRKELYLNRKEPGIRY